MTKLERQEWVAGLGYEGQGFKQFFPNSLFLPAVSLWVALLSSTKIGGRGRGSNNSESNNFLKSNVKQSAN